MRAFWQMDGGPKGGPGGAETENTAPDEDEEQDN